MIAMQKLPTVGQMKARSNSGHRKVLERIAENGKWGRETDTIGTMLGLKTCFYTLARWECIGNGELTQRGRELLEAMS